MANLGSIFRRNAAGARASKARKPRKRKTGDKRSLVSRLVFNRFTLSITGILLILLMLPVIFTFIYMIPGTTPASTIMMARAATLQPVSRIWVPLADISPHMIRSVIMSEDGQFCFHRGIDLAELKGVVDDALKGEKTRGASTIPMQTVKNLFLWPQRSFIRKGLEAPYAVFTDYFWPKQRIMEIYLNIAEFDEGIFGVEAASRHYFNKSASSLSAREAALLATTLPNPKNRNAGKPSRLHTRLANRIQRLAARSGAYIRCVPQAQP